MGDTLVPIGPCILEKDFVLSKSRKTEGRQMPVTNPNDLKLGNNYCVIRTSGGSADLKYVQTEQ